MLNTITEPMAKELERHPVTLLVVTCLIGFAVWSWSQHARASDIETLHTRIDTVSLQYQTLEVSITRATLESQIENIDTELFSLKREVERAQRDNENLPDIYRSRINELTIQHDKKVRELNRLDITAGNLKRQAKESE